MPLHDWNQVDAGIFHAIHTAWIGEIQSALNHGVLPSDYYALAEQHAGGFIADVLTLRIPTVDPTPSGSNGGLATGGLATGGLATGGLATGGSSLLMEAPKTAVHETIEVDLLDKRRTVAIRHVSNHRVVALIEIVSPANKDRQDSVDDFVGKTIHSLSRGIHVLVVDILAPGKFDTGGLHRSIRDAATENDEPTTISDSHRQHQSATFASYQAQKTRLEAFIEHPQLGQPLPAMPIFLNQAQYVYVPLEETYYRAWDGMPTFWKNVVANRS